MLYESNVKRLLCSLNFMICIYIYIYIYINLYSSNIKYKIEGLNLGLIQGLTWYIAYYSDNTQRLFNREIFGAHTLE